MFTYVCCCRRISRRFTSAWYSVLSDSGMLPNTFRKGFPSASSTEIFSSCAIASLYNMVFPDASTIWIASPMTSVTARITAI